jgi:tryptophan-rich sensory protein
MTSSKAKPSPKRSPGRPRKMSSPKVTEPVEDKGLIASVLLIDTPLVAGNEPVVEVKPVKDVITPLAETAAEVLASGIEGQNTHLIEKQKLEEMLKLAPGETNWFEILTSMSFILRLMLVVGVMVVCALIILNVTLDPKSTSWFNGLHKPDWMPDGITITVIFAFLSFLLAWCWFRMSQVFNPMLTNLLFVVVLALQFSWTLLLYRSENLVAGRYLACFFLGFVALLFLLSLWVFGFSDVSLYLFLYTAWLIIVVCFTFGLSDLSKEYKILGIVKDTKSSLYKKKMKMEVMQGIKVDEHGIKTEFNPLEQE